MMGRRRLLTSGWRAGGQVDASDLEQTVWPRCAFLRSLLDLYPAPQARAPTCCLPPENMPHALHLGRAGPDTLPRHARTNSLETPATKVVRRETPVTRSVAD